VRAMRAARSGVAVLTSVALSAAWYAPVAAVAAPSDGTPVPLYRDTRYPLADANAVLGALARDRVEGTAVLMMGS